MAARAAPLTVADAAALFAPVSAARGILLAVSGGPDSMALLRLAAQWRQGGGAPPMSVATVNHGLRPAADAEAAQVALWAAALGFGHQTLVWDGPKPATRLQEAARRARYALLEAHAAAQGADYVALGHHLDDQAETVLFRLLRGSGIDGLAAMDMLSPRGRVTLFRPLLGLPKAALAAVCAAQGQPFLSDPSNQDPRFARTRLRQIAGILEEAGLDAGTLARLAMRAGRARGAIDAAARDMMTQINAVPDGQSISAAIAPLAHAPQEIALRVIGALVEQVRRPGKPVRLDALERLCARLLPALGQSCAVAATLAGTRLVLDTRQRLSIAPEKPRKRGRRAPLRDEQDVEP